MTSVAAVVLTHEDAETVERCLESVAWCDDVVAVHSPSADGTGAVVEAHADTVVTVPPAGPGEPFDHFRNPGVAATDADWVVLLDADEWLPETLTESLRGVVADGGADVVYAPRKNYFRGEWLDAGAYWPDYCAVLARRDAFTITGRVHEFFEPTPDARVTRLPAAERYAIRHRTYDGYLDALRGDRAYARIEGNQRSFSLTRALGALPYTLYRYVVAEGGYRLGWRGVLLALVHAVGRQEAALRSAW